MQEVPREFTEGHFRYRQLERHGMLAIYEQTHKHGSMVRYEVVRIRVRPAHTWPNGITSPAHESYPSAHAWGTDGFTCYSIDEARLILVPWLTRLETPQPASGEVLPV